ncbi:hypothetical protein HYH02_010911 [Chlamydomonas schloesseri]|uniref:Uncharacterized protein n=1 Tax=Chlamydomonas schloesseri TaxID=2026947 RepID=A0A835T3U9_9CHLO|nr:hypothetical protein HYH02_010911 [Chlamydomonas schloesseri]|eukprot:KAG2438457.1 hypothetical protein HYH02_010911 [Chlamydomonas schloesseri]
MWGAGASAALTATSNAAFALKINIKPFMSNIRSWSISAVVSCVLLALVMLVMSAVRARLRLTVDRRGTPIRWQSIWFVASATLTLLWWLLLFILLFVFLGSSVWLGATYGASGVIKLTTKVADATTSAAIRALNTTLQARSVAANASAQGTVATPLQPSNSTAAALAAPFPPPAPPPQPDSDNATSCPATCLDLKLLQYWLERRICICSNKNLRDALAYSQDATSALSVVMGGFFLLWAGASTLLMVASADYAQARRERALLLLLQQQRGGGASSGDVAALVEAAGLGPVEGLNGTTTMPAGSPVKASGTGANPFGQLPPGAADAAGGLAAPSDASGPPYPYPGGGAVGVVADNVPLLQDAAMQQQQQQQAYADPYGYGYPQRVASGTQHQQFQQPPPAYGLPGPNGARPPMYG